METVREPQLDTMQRLTNRGEPDPASDLQHGPSMNQGPSRDRNQEDCEGQNIKKFIVNPSALKRAAKPRLQQMAESADKELQAALDR